MSQKDYCCRQYCKAYRSVASLLPFCYCTDVQNQSYHVCDLGISQVLMMITVCWDMTTY